MCIKIVLVCLVFCVVLAKPKDCEEESEKDVKNATEIKRFKRAKYYSNPPPGTIKYYRRPPPYGYPTKISYTPPPDYNRAEDDMPYPPTPPNSRNQNEDLGDENIHNLVKYLSKQDLDRIIEFASEKERDKLYRAPKDSYDYENARQQFNGNVNNLKPHSNSIGNEKFSLSGPYVSASNPNERQVDKPYQIEYYNNPSNHLVQDANQLKPTFINVRYNVPLDTQESIQYQKAAYPIGPHASHVNNGPSNQWQPDSITATEEILPKPINLREENDNIEGAYTKDVASVATPESGYKVENLGNLPVMNYHSKMFQTSSYNVPHYFITSNPKTSAPTLPVEPASYPQAARDQSDAHLKAIKIWSHRSQGQAYTLHDDGTLSLERPLRQKTKYGYP